MINQASELFELCKEVYKKTGWKCGEPYLKDEVFSMYKESDVLYYLYTSDYLLEKLPNKIKSEHSTGWLTLSPMDKENWGAGYEADHTEHIDDYKFEWSNTPLKALLKLTISLHKAGELK